ncbi:hypothetical protein D3C86_1315760 [compost metagenome]
MFGDQRALNHIHRLLVAGNQRRLLRIGSAAASHAVINRLVLIWHDATARIFRHDLHRVIVGGDDDRCAIGARAGRAAGNQRVNAATDQHQTDCGCNRHDPAATAAFILVTISRRMLHIGILGVAGRVATGRRSLLHGTTEILFQRPFEFIGLFRSLNRTRLGGAAIFRMFVTVETTGDSRRKQRR